MSVLNELIFANSNLHKFSVDIEKVNTRKVFAVWVIHEI